MPTNLFERHIQSVVQIIIAGLLAWVGYSTVTVRETVVRLEVRDAHREKEVADLRSAVSSLRLEVTTAATAAAAAASAAAAAAALSAKR